MEFDEAVVQDICRVLSNLKSPDPSVQAQIFDRFQRLQCEQPMLCFFLAHVVMDERFAMDLKYAAILVLYRSLDQLKPDFAHRFIEYAVPILRKLLDGGDPFLSKYSVAILTSLFGRFGAEACPFFIDLVSFLFQQEGSVEDAINCLNELALVKKDVPEELLALALSCFAGPHMYQILTVFRKVASRHVDFFSEKVMPLILASCSNMTPACVGESGAIAVVCYGRYPEPAFGAFIAQCVMSNSSPVHSCAIAELLDSPLTEPFEPLIIALMHRIAFQDEEFMGDGTCVMCQTIIEEMAKWSSEVPPMVIRHLDKCVNAGHFCRCLYPVIQVLTNASEFIEVIESHMQGPFKGDAATCLMSACFSIPTYAGRAIDLIVPLLIDDSEYVRQQSIFALTELFEFEFEPKREILEFLIQTFKTQTGSDLVTCAQLINRYVVHFQMLEFTPLIRDYLQYICHCFLEASQDHPLLPAAAETLASLVQLAPDPDRQAVVPPILSRTHYLMATDDPNLISSLCFLLGCLLRSFAEIVASSSEASSICNRISTLLTVEDNPQMIISVLDPVGQIIEKAPTLATAFTETWTAIMTSIFTVSNMDLSSAISQILIKLVPTLPPSVCEELLHKCGLVVMMARELTESQMKIYELGKAIIQRIQSAGGQVDESLCSAFAR